MARDDVDDVSRTAGDADGHAGRRCQQSGGGAEIADEVSRFVAIRAVRREERERGQVSACRRLETDRRVTISRPTGIRIDQLVLGERHAGVDVDEALDPRDTGVCSETARVVVQPIEIRGRSGRAGRADGQLERCELALAERACEQIVRSARRHAGGQDRSVRRVEPDVQEWDAQEKQDGQGRDKHGDRSVHHPVGQARPATIGAGSGSHPAYRERVEARPEDGQQRRQEGERG